MLAGREFDCESVCCWHQVPGPEVQVVLGPGFDVTRLSTPSLGPLGMLLEGVSKGVDGGNRRVLDQPASVTFAICAL